MGAYDEFISRIGNNIVEPARKKLVSTRGSIISGTLPCSMDLTGINRIGYPIGLKIKGSTKRGFIFNPEGRNKIIESVASSGFMRLLDFQDLLLFDEEEKSKIWKEQSAYEKKNRMKAIVEKMMKDAVASFYAIGDRQQYLVLGRIDYTERKENSVKQKQVPLFLFPLKGERMNIIRDLSFEVEQTGFLNFLLDDDFGGEIKKIVGKEVFDISPSINGVLLRINEIIPSKSFSGIENVVVDPNYAMIGSVTGLQAEYFDPTWEKMA